MRHYYGSHDISHCDGKYCQIKETCKRYLAHLDLIDYFHNYYMTTYVIIEEKDINESGGCDIYWKN